MIWAQPRTVLDVLLGRLGLESNRSLRNAMEPLVLPPAYLYDLALTICTRGPNPQGLTPRDLMSERYPDQVITE